MRFSQLRCRHLRGVGRGSLCVARFEQFFLLVERSVGASEGFYVVAYEGVGDVGVGRGGKLQEVFLLCGDVYLEEVPGLLLVVGAEYRLEHGVAAVFLLLLLLKRRLLLIISAMSTTATSIMTGAPPQCMRAAMMAAPMNATAAVINHPPITDITSGDAEHGAFAAPCAVG